MEVESTPTETKPKKNYCCKILLFFIFLSLTLSAGTYWYLTKDGTKTSMASPLSKILEPRPLDNYTFEALSERKPTKSPIVLEENLSLSNSYDSHVFSFTTDGGRVTGQINLPANYQATKSPAIIMLRGWVDPAAYTTGVGTKAAAEFFAQRGYITIAPDFLGYGGSDPEDSDSFAARLKRPVTVLDLLESIKSLSYIDQNNIFMWAHSNGGQIALSVLEITKLPIPTTLWAPVSKPFPYSILYYTDESEDRGKALRKALAKFENTYDVELYSIDKYWDRISAPLQIHQGSADDAIPVTWSDELVESLKLAQKYQESSGSAKLEYSYHIYPGADHNLRPGWDTAVARDLEFFKKYTK